MGGIDLSRYIWPDANEGRQPQGPVWIDRSNPLAATITNFIPFGGINWDVVTGQEITLFSGAAQHVDGRGKSLKGSGAAAVGSIPLDLSAYNKLTVSFWMYWDSFADDDDFAMELTPNSNTNIGAFSINPNASGSGSKAGVYTLLSGEGGKYSTFTRPSASAWHHYAITMDRTVASGGSITVAVDGVQAAVTDVVVLPGNSTPFANSTLYLFSRNNAALFGAGRMQNLIFRGGHIMSPKEIRDEYETSWQIFGAPLDIGWPGSAAAGGTLNAAAVGSSQAAGAANLATQVALAAVGISTAGGAAIGSATTNIPLAAAGIAVSAGAATPTATVTITAAGLAHAAGQAGLSASLLLAGAGAAAASGNAVLTTQLLGSATAAAQASGNAALAAQIAAVASGAGAAIGNASLAAQINALAAGAAGAAGTANLSGGAPGTLNANGQAQAIGSAVLTVSVNLIAAGNAQAAGSAAGTASAPGALAASGSAQTSGGATWSVLTTLTAAGFVQAMGAGAFVVEVPLSASGHAATAGSAAAVLLGETRNYRLAATAQRLTQASCHAQRLTTLHHEVRHA